MTVNSDNRSIAFEALVETQLHKLSAPEAWDRYYAEMASWLTDEDASRRKRCLERLTMAVLWSEPSSAQHQDHSADVTPHDASPRFSWLLRMIDEASATHHDTIPNFLGELRFIDTKPPLTPALMVWLQDLRVNPRPGVVDDDVEGTLLLVERHDEDDPATVARLITLLDHASDYVRACAARKLSGMDGAASEARMLFALIKDKDIARPGVAGPYWSEWQFVDREHLPVDPLDWMMDILERRVGPEPDDPPFNGIDFHLHELCCASPETVQRILDGGYVRLAIETATEIRGVVADMKPMLVRLAGHADDNISHRTAAHLAFYYRTLSAAPQRHPIRRWHDWAEDADVFSLHSVKDGALAFVILYPREEDAHLSDQSAWTLIDRVIAPELRGPMIRHYMEPPDALASPYIMADRMMFWFQSRVHVELTGDVAARRWTRIEISGGALGARWSTFQL
jgi:hypothetical protein